MNIEEIENILYDNDIKLDIRVMSSNKFNLPYHIRLINPIGKYIIDIYFKHNKQLQIVRNTFFIHKTQTWGVFQNETHLLNTINSLL